MGKEQDLVQAIKGNDVESFKKLITKFKPKNKKSHKKTALHIVDHDGFTPLHHAALSGNGEVVMGLLEFATDVNAKDKKGMTPLHLAAWAGKVEPALLLLDAGAQTNLCSRSGATPLHLASEHGNYGVVERLVDHDCDPTVVNNQGETALDLACRFGHLEVVRILLNNSRGKCEKLLNPKEFQEKASPLHMAAKTGHCDVVRLLVEAGADINQRGPTGSCLHEAALYGKTEVVKYLVEAGIEVNLKNREGQTALDIVTQFTKSGASSEIKNILREASVEVVYAKAVKDYANIKDDSFLTLRMGDIVLVLERRKDGTWKGCVRDDKEKERIGFFPSSVVKVLRSPSRNSVKRSSSSSSEASKVSTVGTVSNTFEIVTVSPPNQPVASKSRAPRMSSFRKKAPPNRSISENDDHRARSNDARRNTADSTRSQSENDIEDKGKKLNYLDIVVVEKHNEKNKTGPTSPPAIKTEYADVFIPNNEGGTNEHESTSVDNKDIVRTSETQKSVRVNGSYARLGQQMLGKQSSEDKDKLREELQRQQEERLKRQRKKLEEEKEKRKNEQQEKEPQVEEKLQQQQKLEEKQKVLEKEQEHHKADLDHTSSQTDLPPKAPLLSMNAQHSTVSSQVTHPKDLSPLPLMKHHLLSGDQPSNPSVAEPLLPIKLEKKRSSLRTDRRGTSPPPPPPPPPSGSATPSPVMSPNGTPRSQPVKLETSPFTLANKPACSDSPILPPLPKPVEVQNHTLSVGDTSVRSASPSFPLPPPETDSPLSPTVIITNPPTQDERSPTPPLPPAPTTLASPSSTSLGDFPPPPVTLMDSSEDTNPLPKTSELTDFSTSSKTVELAEAHTSTLHPPTRSQSHSGYEDMSRLRKLWTKPEADVDKKGYVMVTPLKHSTTLPSPVNPATSPKPLSVSSKLYENFIPLKTRNFEVRRLGSSSDKAPRNAGENSPPKSGVPEKPCRHCYVNCEVSGQGKEPCGSCHGKQERTNDDSSEKSDEKSTPLPVQRVPPVPQVAANLSAGPDNIRMREYNELYDWLAQSKLLTYMDNFAAAGFDLSAIADLTAEDLSDILITKTGHRKRLLSEASKLSIPERTFENNVPSWLHSLGLSKYEKQFIDGGFDELEFLYDITKEDLEAIGITMIGHQRRIIVAAKKLQREDEEEAKFPVVPDNEIDCASDDITHVGVSRVAADERVGEYAVPRVSYITGSKRNVDESSSVEKSVADETILGTEFEQSSKELEVVEESVENSGEYYVEENVDMNGHSDEIVVDGVKDLAASFQHQIHVETAKAKGKPPPVKPKSYKKAPPPAVAPKPKTNGVKAHKIDLNHNDANSRVDFTEVIKEAEALSESGSEQSPPSTLDRADRKSESGVSIGSSLATSGSQGSLNSESEDLQREIKESLHQRPSSGTSFEEISKLAHLTLSQEDLLEQQKREEELEKYQQEQSKTESLFNDIQGMLDDMNSELDDMFK